MEFIKMNKSAAEDLSSQSAQNSKAHEMHFAVAEYGKVMALQNRHSDALHHYREAIRLAVSCKAPEIFFRHYTQCVLESLELTGSHREVIDFCNNAHGHYQSLKVSLQLHKKDHGAVLERGAVNYLKSGDKAAAIDYLQQAIDCSGKGVLPLAEELLQWLRRGLVVDGPRLLSLQKKHKYFVVRPEQVNKEQARSLESIQRGKVGAAGVFST
jgi:tetratricopeptide (TPR) repeat protein